jgi:hypothetical protein
MIDFAPDAGLQTVQHQDETTRQIAEGELIPVLAVVAMPPEARFATFQQIHDTLRDPRNASVVLHGLATHAHRQLSGLTPIPPMLMVAALQAIKLSPLAES